MQGVNDGDIVMKANYEFIPQDDNDMSLKDGQVRQYMYIGCWLLLILCVYIHSIHFM